MLENNESMVLIEITLHLYVSVLSLSPIIKQRQGRMITFADCMDCSNLRSQQTSFLVKCKTVQSVSYVLNIYEHFENSYKKLVKIIENVKK